MKILAIEHEVPGTAPDQFTPQLKRAEAERVWELCQADIIREVYFRADRSEAVLVLECASVAEAERALATLPMVAASLIAFEVIPLAPYPGLSRLFASTQPS